MNFVNQMSDTVNDLVNNNKIINPILALLLVLYVVMAAPNLPKSVAKFFNYPVVKFIYMFLIVYLASKERSPTVAILVVVAFLVTVQAFSYYDTSDKLVNTMAPVNNQVATNPTAAAIQTADLHQNASINAIHNGDLASAHVHAMEHSRHSMIARLLSMIEGHKKAASTVDRNNADLHLQQAASKEKLVNALQNGTMTPDDVNSVLSNNNSDVVGYIENQQNEVWADADSSYDINNSGVQEVEGAVEREDFQAKLPSFVNEMNVINEFAPMNPYATVEVRKAPGADFGPYASFKESACDDIKYTEYGRIPLDNTDNMNNMITSDVLYNPGH